MGRPVDLSHAPQGSARREPITSTANPQVKAIRALASRKERERSGRYFVEGIRPVAQALECGADIVQLVVAPDVLDSAFARAMVEDAARRGVPVLNVSGVVFASISDRDGPQGLAAVGRQRWVDLDTVGTERAAWWLALDRPQDPGNVGTILRTCDALGVDGLVLLGPAADPYGPQALRASEGGAFSVRLARSGWAEFLAWVRRERFSLVGASVSGGDDYKAMRVEERQVLLMGSEREGLSVEQAAACDRRVSLPMYGRVDSLNLAVATGVLLYEMASLRHKARA